MPSAWGKMCAIDSAMIATSSSSDCAEKSQLDICPISRSVRLFCRSCSDTEAAWSIRSRYGVTSRSIEMKPVRLSCASNSGLMVSLIQ